MSIQLRNWFFQVTKTALKRGSRFRDDDKPPQATMQNLVDSTAFLAESSDRSKLSAAGNIEDEQGLAVLATDAQTKSNAAQLVDRSLVVQPHQTTTAKTENQDINLANDTDFTGDSPLEVLDDVAVTTRKDFIVRLKASFITWLEGVLDAIRSDVDTNTTNIATNTANIATNTANIATNTANIATNTANIATNAANITNNDTDISNLQSATGESTATPNYSSTNIITQNADHNQVLAELDAAVQANKDLTDQLNSPWISQSNMTVNFTGGTTNLQTLVRTTHKIVGKTLFLDVGFDYEVTAGTLTQIDLDISTLAGSPQWQTGLVSNFAPQGSLNLFNGATGATLPVNALIGSTQDLIRLEVLNATGNFPSPGTTDVQALRGQFHFPID